MRSIGFKYEHWTFNDFLMWAPLSHFHGRMKFLEMKLSILGILCIEVLDIITDQKLKAELNIKSKDRTF